MTVEKNAREIFLGGSAPADPAENTAFHQLLLEELAGEVGRQGWPGVRFTHYSRRTGFVLIGIAAGGEALDLAALRQFRDNRAGKPEWDEAGEERAA